MMLLCIFLSRISWSQGIRDSLFVLKEVNVSAQKLFAKETAGMKETHIDSLVLADKISQTLSELLSENSSIFIKSHGRGALATASFRGTAASHTKVFWNGINITSPMTGMVDFSLIPVYVIDEVALSHGAASIAQQSGGLGGSVNISNNTNWNNKLTAAYMQGVGSFSTYDEFLTVALGSKKLQSSTRLYHNQSANNYTFLNRSIGNIDPETGNIVHPRDTNKLADYQRYGFLQEMYYRPRDNRTLTFRWWGQWADRSIPRVTSFEGSDNANINQQKDLDQKIVIDWNRYGEKGKWLFRSGYAEKHLNYTLRNFVPGAGLIPAVYSESRQNSLYNQISHTLSSSASFSTEIKLEANRHQVASRDSVQKTGYGVARWEQFAFLTMRKRFGQRINLNLMFRQEWVAQKAHPFIPYLGIDYKVVKERDWVIKAHIARNHHYPSLNDLYWQPGGNPDLLPEEGLNIEMGTAHQVVLGNTSITSELTFYRNDINNWIIWIPSFKGYWEPMNIKNVLSKGLEANLKYRGISGHWDYSIFASYTYTQARNYGDPLVWGDESYGKQLVYVPLHSGNLMAKLSFKKFTIGWQHNAYSERYTTSSNDVSRRDWLYPYFMNDLSLAHHHMTGKVEIHTQLKAYNVFDESYHSILYRPMPGRHYHLMLTFKFKK